MRKNILKIATKKFQKLSKKYNKFINVFVDDWRGFRFVFDTDDVRNCKNNCKECSLFKLLKTEKEFLFSAGLYPASEKDKKLFGQQNFLNCKTLEQYKDCYVNFLIKNANNKTVIAKELELLRQSTIIYTKNSAKAALEKKFKDDIMSTVQSYTQPNAKNYSQILTSKL